MDYILNNKGEIFKNEHSNHVLNSRIVKYGDGFFETIRVFDGNIFYISNHWERINKAKKVLRFNFPEEWNFDYFKYQFEKLINKTGYQNARIRIQFYRESDAYYFPNNSSLHWFAIISELSLNQYKLNENGIKLVINLEIRNSYDILTEIKSTNSLRYVLAAIYGKEQNADDSIILNYKGNICETSNSNIFMVYKNTLLTPPYEKNCLDGIMRKKVLEIANLLKIKVSIRDISVEELLLAEEIFICNSISGIQWVSEIEGKQNFNKEYATLLINQINKSLRTL